MGWVNKLIDKYTDRFFNSLEITIVNKIILVYFISAIAFFSFLVFGIIAVLNEHYYLSVLLLVVFIILTANFIYLYKTAKHNLCGYVLIYTIAIVLIILLVTGGTSGTGHLWIYCYPILVISIMGSKKGGYHSFLFFLASLAILIIHKYLPVNINYNITFAVRFLGTYLVIHLIIYFFEFQRNYNYQKLVRSILATKEESNKKDDFISKLSHQIRTPLNNITMISNLVNRSKLDSRHRDLFDTIIASNNNLVNIVNNIVKVSDLKLVDEVITKVRFDLYETINNTLILFRDQYRNRINLSFSFSKKIKNNLVGDPVRIKQLFMNIIENVIKVSSEKKISIEIKVDLKKETARKVELMFNIRFPYLSLVKDIYGNYRVQSGKKQMNIKTQQLVDRSLDFSLSRRLISLQSGDLEVNNEARQTVISFLLKFSKDADSTELLKQEDAEIETEELLKIQKKKIDLKDANVLLVEDNAVNQKIILLSLKNSVKNIDLANNGKEALDKFGKSKYDLILMDIQMPIMNGIVATKKIRELELSTNTQTPIIAVTANALTGDKEACIASGMNDYISKPFQVEVLIQKMRVLLEKEA